MSAIVQVEISVTDVEQSLTFYQQVFGWTEVPVDIHNYVIMHVGDDSSYGVSLRKANANSATGSTVVLFVAITDPAKTLETVKSLGGTVISGPQTLPSYGRTWHIEDLDGQRWGLFQSATTPKE